MWGQKAILIEHTVSVCQLIRGQITYFENPPVSFVLGCLDFDLVCMCIDQTPLYC